MAPCLGLQIVILYRFGGVFHRKKQIVVQKYVFLHVPDVWEVSDYLQSIQRAKIYGGEYIWGFVEKAHMNATIKQERHFFSKSAQKFFQISLVGYSGDLPLTLPEEFCFVHSCSGWSSFRHTVSNKRVGLDWEGANPVQKAEKHFDVL